MATAFKKNVGKTLITKKGKKCTIMAALKHSYRVMSSDRDEVFEVWGFDIDDHNADVLYEVKQPF